MADTISCDPNDLVAAAKCYQCQIPRGQQTAVIIYLLNEIVGLGYTPAQLAENAKCYHCIPRRMQPEVQAYILNEITALGLTVSQLVENAKCFECIPPGMAGSVFIHILNQASGLNLSSEQLLANSACYQCLDPGVQIDVETYLMCLLPAGSSACQHDTADAWVARVVANGGAVPSDATYAAVCEFCTGLDTDLLTAKMIAVNCIVPDSLTAALTPLIVGTGGNALWTNTGPFVDADLTVNGLISDGTKYLKTGIIPSAVFAADTSGGMSYYHVTSSASNWFDMGCVQGGNRINLVNSYTNTAYLDCWNSTAGQGRISATNTSWAGFMSGNRTAANAFAIYQGNGTTGFTQLVAGNTTGASRPTTYDVWAFTINNGGAPQFTNSRRHSFFAIHEGLTLGEAVKLYNLVVTLRTALGGGLYP